MAPTKEEVAKMTVPVLKAALTELNLPVTGKKDELVARYIAALGSKSAPATEAEAPVEPVAAASAAEPVADAGPSPAVPEPAEPALPSKHARIVFDDAKSVHVAAQKLEVVKPAAAPIAAKPVLSEAEKARLRAEKFQDPETAKAKARAQRFNLVHPDLEKEKALKRAERFGMQHPELEEKKKSARAERFGIVDEGTKLEQRKERFKPLPGAKAVISAPDDHEARKKARAERFAVNA